MPFSAGAVLAFTAAAFFSLKAIFVKLAYIYHVDAVTLLALRMLLCLPVLLISAWWSSRSHAHRMTRQDWIAVIFLGAVGYYLSSLLDFMGLAYITAGLERLILFLYPTIVAIISVFLFKKPIGRTGIIALVLSYIGIGLATIETVNTTGDVHAVVVGSALIFACTITYAIYIAGSGQIVAAGTELFRLVRQSQIELNAQVPEADLPYVRAGMSASVAGERGLTAIGTVRLVTPQVDPQTRLGFARITLPPGSGFRPGNFGNATINVGVAPSVAVPNTAIVFRDGRPGVFTVDAHHIVHFRLVTLGERTATLVGVGGVPAGARVVINGGFLGDGNFVSVAGEPDVEPPAKPAPPKKGKK